MNNIEIKEAIDRNNQIIQSIFSPSGFTLNNTISQLLDENRALQAKCKHEFENGYCIYCYKEEE